MPVGAIHLSGRSLSLWTEGGAANSRSFKIKVLLAMSIVTWTKSVPLIWSPGFCALITLTIWTCASLARLFINKLKCWHVTCCRQRALHNAYPSWLIPLDAKDAETVRMTKAKALTKLPRYLARSFKFDLGKKMSQHIAFPISTGMKTYCARLLGSEERIKIQAA